MDLYNVRKKIMSGENIDNIKLKVAFYARVSTEKDAQLHSLSSQVVFFKEYINKNLNWEYVDGYIDEGISGTSVTKREDFLRMIDDAKKGKFDLIVTKEISRFSRNTLDSVKYTQELLLLGVGVFFLNDNINTILPDSELRLTIMASVAQDEVRKLSERVCFGMRRSIEKGVVLGGSNIYGYVKNKGKLLIDEQQAKMIKYIYYNYANTNISLSLLSRMLEKNGYLNTKGKRLDLSVIERIIANPKYKGYYCGNKSTIVDYRTKKKKKLNFNEWKIYKDHKACPPIVSEDLWDRANKKLNNLKTSFINKTNDLKVFQNRYTYSGKIYCHIHDTTYHRNSAGNRKNNPTWECNMYRKYGIKGCENIKVYEHKLDLYFKDIFKIKILKNSLIIDELKLIYEDYLKENSTDNIVLNINKQKNTLEHKKNCLLELFLENHIEKADYLKRIINIDNEINKCNSKIKQINLNNNKQLINKIDLCDSNLLINDLLAYRELFNLLVKKVLIYKNGNIKVKYNYWN